MAREPVVRWRRRQALIRYHPPMITRVLTVDVSEAEGIREILAGRMRLQIAERRHWLLWRKFTIMGPQDAVQAAVADVDEWLAEDAAQRAW
jgi:hypothetical protein